MRRTVVDAAMDVVKGLYREIGTQGVVSGFLQ